MNKRQKKKRYKQIVSTKGYAYYAIHYLNIKNKKQNRDKCKWQWNEDLQNNEVFALIECKGMSYGDRVIFNSIRLFTYCPYCSKEIRVIN